MLLRNGSVSLFTIHHLKKLGTSIYLKQQEQQQKNMAKD